jgi:PAS domain S-box-containing protein
LFREPTVWDRYRGWIISGVLICVIEAFLIFVLIANLIRRRRAEQSLAESEQRFRIAADAAPIMIWMTGVDKSCTYLSKLWLEFTGRTLEQETGNGWVESVHPDDRQSCFKTYADAFDARQQFVMEYRLRRHDGEYRWICDSGKPRYDAERKFVGYVGSCVDLTESRRKAEALAESYNRLRSILETAVDGIITVNNQGVIESVNPAAERIFRYDGAEMIGQDMTVVIPAPLGNGHNSSAVDFQWSGLSATSNSVHEVSGRRKDGSVFPMDLTINRVDLMGGRIFTCFVRDITERKRTEQASREFGGRLLQAQEEERARLARELHDDITQRLARLAIDAGRAESEPANGNNGKPLRDVREGIARLSEDLHSLSYRLHPSMLTDLGLTAALRAECESFSEDSSISTEVDLLEISEKIPQDASLGLFRIAQEALHNVARHSGSKVAKVILRPLDGGLQLAVVDYGIGFDSGRRKQRQSLGLASMHERVRLLGGELDIESALGYGTTILAWVPLKGEI